MDESRTKIRVSRSAGDRHEKLSVPASANGRTCRRARARSCWTGNRARGYCNQDYPSSRNSASSPPKPLPNSNGIKRFLALGLLAPRTPTA